MRWQKWRRGLLLGGCVLACQPAGMIAARAAGQTVKIGAILALTGPGADIGQSIERGIDLYVKLHKQDLPKGVDLQVIERDDGSNPATTRRIAQELVVRDHVQMLAGFTLSPQGFAVAQVATEAKLPTLLMNATTGSIPRKSSYIVRFSHSNWQMAYAMGIWAAKHGIRNAYTLVTDYAAGIDMQAAFTRGFTDNGGKIVGADRPPMNTSDFLPYMERIKAAKPQALFVFMIAGRSTIAAMKAFGDAGLHSAGVQLIGTGDVVPDDELPQTGPDALGMIDTSIYSATDPRPQNVAFVKAWQHAYGADTEPDFASVGAWNGMTAIFDVIRKLGPNFTGDAAMAVLKNFKDPDSPQGPIAIDPQTRDIVLNVYVDRIEKVDGRYENVTFETIPDMKDPWKQLNPAK